MRIKDLIGYPEDRRLSGDEYLFGSDTDDRGKSRNYRLREIARFILEGMNVDGIDQDNIVVHRELGDIDPNRIGRNIAEAVNALNEFEIKEKEIFIFSCMFRATETPRPIRSTPNANVVYKNHIYIFKRGKGFYGTSIDNPTDVVSFSDFVLLNKSEMELPSFSGGQPILFTILNSAGLSAVAAVNASLSSYEIGANTDAYFQIGNVEGSQGTIVYRFIGTPGIYGFNGSSITINDLITLERAGFGNYATTEIRIKEFDPIMLTNRTKSTEINSLPLFEVSKNEVAVFNFRRALSDGYIEKSSWFYKGGKGFFGVTPPGVEFAFLRTVRDQDLLLNRTSLFRAGVIDGETAPRLYDLNNSEESDIVDAINNSEEPIEVNSLVYVTVVEMNDVMYRFIGANGVYGAGHLSCTQGDLETIEESAQNNIEDVLEFIRLSDLVYEGKNTFNDQASFLNGIRLQEDARGLPSIEKEEGRIITNLGRALIFIDGAWHEFKLSPVVE